MMPLIIISLVFASACSSSQERNSRASAPTTTLALSVTEFCPAMKAFSKALSYTEGGWGNHMGNIKYNDDMRGSVRIPFESLQSALDELNRVSPVEFLDGIKPLLAYTNSYVATLRRFDFDLQRIISESTPAEISYLAEWGSNSIFDDEDYSTVLTPEIWKYTEIHCINKLGEDWWMQS
jgi:hypothetical protein